MKKAMSIFLCICLVLCMAVATSARFTNIITYICTAPLKGSAVGTQAHMDLANIPSGSKIQLVIQEFG